MLYFLAACALFVVMLIVSLIYAVPLYRNRRAICKHADENPPANDLWS